jgi:hypothetical protein
MLLLEITVAEFAYHFVGATLRDGSSIPEIGVWEVFEGECVMCESGLHASRHPFDALKYAPGATLRLVEVEDIYSEHNDKLVCKRRRTVRQIDAADLCRAFARRCALDVIHLWDAPAIVKQYLETGDNSIAAEAAWVASAAARAAPAGDAAAAAAAAAAWNAAAAAWDAAARAAAARAAAAGQICGVYQFAAATLRARFQEMVNAVFGE